MFGFRAKPGDTSPVATHLRVDLDVLGRAASDLAALDGEFTHSASIAEGAGAAVGAPELVDAVHDFATNWKRHREKISKSITALAAMADQGQQAYASVDQQLADALTKPATPHR